MQTFRTESNYRSANRLSPAELRAAMSMVAETQQISAKNIL